MTSSTSNSSQAAGALALLLPLLLIGAAVAALWAPVEQERTPAALVMEARLAEKPPQVLILGNSIAEHAVDLPALGKAMGGKPIQSLTVYASPPPTWYAVYKNRVLANGYRPELVLVIGTLDFFTQTQVRTEMQRKALAEHVGVDEPVIASKSLGQQVGRVPERVRLRRAALREAFIEAGRLFFLRSDGTSVIRARERAGQASVRVFEEDDRSDFALQRRVIPVVEVRGRSGGEGEQSIAASFVPDLVELASQSQARIVFVRAPLPPSSAAAAPGSAEAARDLVAWLNDNGAGYIDLSSMGLAESAFRDATHLNARGREAFTKALATELVRIGADKEGALTPAALPVVADEVIRTGTPPDLPALNPLTAKVDGPCVLRFEMKGWGRLSTDRLQEMDVFNAEPIQVLQDGEHLTRVKGRKAMAEGCSGSFAHLGTSLWISPRRAALPGDGKILDGLSIEARLDPAAEIVAPSGRRWRWLYAGTGLEFQLADGFEVKGESMVVQAELTEMVEGQPSRLAVVDEAGTELSNAPFAAIEGGAPSLRQARLRLPPVVGSLRLRIEAPVGGGISLLRSLAIGSEPGDLVWLVGSDSSNSTLRLIGGSANAPEYEGEAPVVAPKAVPVAGPVPKVGKIWVPGLEPLSNLRVQKSIGEYDCSPVMVLEDGQPLPGRHAKCSAVSKGQGKAGAYCHVAKEVLLLASDGSDPSSNGRTYRLQLDPKPFCKGMWWLYPGQTALREIKPKGLQSLQRGAEWLKIQARVLLDTGEAGHSMKVQLYSGEQLLVDQEVPLDTFGEEPVGLRLASPVGAGGPGLRLRLSTPTDAPYTVLKQVVVETAPPSTGEAQ